MGWREREKEREGLGQGGTRDEKRQVVALGRERTTREEGGKEGSVREEVRSDCPQKHQTIHPPSPSKQIKAIYS